LIELPTRWELPESHPYSAYGIDETMSIDQNLHSLFGVSKTAADLLVQQYGRYFGLKTVCFRGGCLTGPGHSGAELHGFLAYLVKCAVAGLPYTVFGYGGKQVRDNIHASDLVRAFWHFFQAPRSGEVYNIGGGRRSNCSMLEAIAKCERLTGRPMSWSYSGTNGSAITSGGSATRAGSNRIIPNGRSGMGSMRSLAEIHDAVSERCRRAQVA
jgi:CDP-paratose 2-epimerase